MAATVGELVVALKARTAAFTKGMAGAGRNVTTFGNKVGMAAKRMIAFGGAMAGIASVGGIAIMIKRNLALMDATGKLADRIGITTEALQGLRHAAELTGAGADTLDAGLTTMAKRLGEAARGAGAATPALKMLGLSIDDLIQKSPDQQFITIAEAIKKLGTHTERAAAAANIFSKGNMALINTLAEGRAGLEAMQAEAEKLGVTFSAETAKKAEDANDAISRLKAAMGGSMISVTADLAEQIRDLADAMREIPSVATTFRGNLLRWIAESQESFLEQNNGMTPEWAEWIKQMRISGGQMDEGGAGRGSRASRAARRGARNAASNAAAEAAASVNAPLFDPFGPGQEPSRQFAAHMKAEQDAMVERIKALRNAIGGAMGGDGASLQLAGAATMGSAAAYSAIARRGLEGGAKKTDEQILEIARKQLRADEKSEQHLQELVQRLLGEDDAQVEIR